jgi:6-phosphogluconolactonase (cycloisomerase 2 family)
MTNSPLGNSVAVYHRFPDGSLAPAGLVPTGGTGTGSGLGNQGGLILSEQGNRLLAVNAGSNQVSVFAVAGGGLVLTDVEPSGGDTPASVTLHGDLVYVLNTGGVGNITGFKLSPDGRLAPLAGSTRPLSDSGTGPAQIAFSPSGDMLVVTEKATSRIDTYLVGEDGLAAGPNAQPSVGTTPFGFAFGKRDVLLVSEAFGGAPDASALSSYRLAADGSLQVISASVPTTETAACWVAVPNSGRLAFTSNTGSGSVSGFEVRPDGGLSRLDADGRTGVTGPNSSPIDMAFSRDSRFLYVLSAGTHAIAAFSLGPHGSLSPLGAVGGLPAGANGLAAR